ncbi:MAG TPA: hypothetical protein VHV76_09280 [Mycobacteriales bacterium]|jgi:hypothetical protein|nr:hypothetical protein [Mycobacteriales bacterium]
MRFHRVVRRAALVATAAAVIVVPLTHNSKSANAIAGPTLPTNDLEAMLTLTGAQLAPMDTPVLVPAPRLKADPRADCTSGRSLAGVQGRVSQADVNSPTAARGWTCNLTEIAHYATPGGFRVWRYTDPAGHVCAYYDTSFVTPANLVSVAGGPSLGVEVLDVSHPAHPHHTATLTTLAMLAPHESLNLNAKRGLLAAEVGNGLTLPGTFSVYDVHSDCRHPRLLAQLAVPTGHESGFSPDGRTFYAAGGAGYISAIDLSDPSKPRFIWRGAYYSHGLNLSVDGKTLYQTDPINGSLGIIDVSQIQDRVPHPKVHDISRIRWNPISIPQNTVPFTSHGHHYLLEFDEFAFRFNPVTVDDAPGAARIINIDHPRHPRISSDLRLAVQMPDEHAKLHNDPGELPNQVLGYSMHYCAIPRMVNPQIVACSAINSGLRVFNISNPAHPREVAYYVSPPKAGAGLNLTPGDLAFSQPAFDPARREIYYTDAVSGFYVLHLSASAWPR